MFWRRRPNVTPDVVVAEQLRAEHRRHEREIAAAHRQIDRLTAEIGAYEQMRRRAAEVEPRAKEVDRNARELVELANAVAWREKALMDERSAMFSQTAAAAHRLAQQALADGRFYWTDVAPSARD